MAPISSGSSSCVAQRRIRSLPRAASRRSGKSAPSTGWGWTPRLAWRSTRIDCARAESLSGPASPVTFLTIRLHKTIRHPRLSVLCPIRLYDVGARTKTHSREGTHDAPLRSPRIPPHTDHRHSDRGNLRPGTFASILLRAPKIPPRLHEIFRLRTRGSQAQGRQAQYCRNRRHRTRPEKWLRCHLFQRRPHLSHFSGRVQYCRNRRNRTRPEKWLRCHLSKMRPSLEQDIEAIFL